MRLFDGIRSGVVTVAFRAWRRPTVKAGGTLITPVGQLAIDRVEVVDPSTITDADAALAGEASAHDVRRSLRQGDDRAVHRIDFHLAGDDPRAALRTDTALSDDEWDALTRKLDAMDARSAEGPWTAATLREIAARPGVVSSVLAEAVGLPRPEFKLRVRRLKALGLTESLGTGYRISPRGEALMKRRS
jgi:hypothetical protein